MGKFRLHVFDHIRQYQRTRTEKFDCPEAARKRMIELQEDFIPAEIYNPDGSLRQRNFPNPYAPGSAEACRCWEAKDVQYKNLPWGPF